MIFSNYVSCNLRIRGIQQEKISDCPESGSPDREWVYPLVCSRFLEILMPLAGINYCSASTAWIKLFTSPKKHLKVPLGWPAFPLLGFPWGMQLGTNQIKQTGRERNLVGRRREKVDIIIWKCTHVPLVKNRLNWIKPRQWKFYKSTVLLYFKWSGLSLFDARCTLLLVSTPNSLHILELWNLVRIR